MSSSREAAVLAAGAVIWRTSPAGVEVLLVERTKHRDLTVPKGKLDPGETLPECAVREMNEETGLAVRLGAPLRTIQYALPDGRRKVVRYWHAEASAAAIAASDFSPNGEVKAVHWLTVDEAKVSCTYQEDVRLLESFEAMIKAGEQHTVALVALRHGKAADPYRWEGPDSTRELTDRGKTQAKQIAGGLAAFGVTRVQASTAKRCLQTVAPLAKRLGAEVHSSKHLSQDSFTGDDDGIGRKVAKALEKQRSTVFCSHAPVIPAIVASIAEQTDAQIDQELRFSAHLSTAEFSVFHVTVGEHPRLVAFETHAPPEH